MHIIYTMSQRHGIHGLNKNNIWTKIIQNMINMAMNVRHSIYRMRQIRRLHKFPLPHVHLRDRFNPQETFPLKNRSDRHICAMALEGGEQFQR